MFFFKKKKKKKKKKKMCFISKTVYPPFSFFLSTPGGQWHNLFSSNEGKFLRARVCVCVVCA